MRFTIFLCCCALAPVLAQAQGRGGGNIFGYDAQHSGWDKAENEITLDNVKNLKLEWSAKLDIEPKALNGLTPPIARANLATPRGVKDVVIVGGVSDKLFVVNGDTGKIFWEKTLSVEGAPKRSANWLCPNGLNSTPVIGQAPVGARPGQTVYVLASDGRLHGFNLVSGEEVMPPTPFVPPFGKTWSLNTAGNVIYTTTSQGCNGVKSGVWAMDLHDPGHKVSEFYSSAGAPGGIWGRAGAAITADGRIVAETGDGASDPDKGLYGDSVIALTPKDLKLSDYFTPKNPLWITKKDLDMGSISPIVFPFKDKELIAASGKEGIIYLLDSKSLGGADHRTPLYKSPLFANAEVNFAGAGFWGAFSTWEDSKGTRWLLAPAWGPPTPDTKFENSYGPAPNGSVMAFKVEQKGDKPVLTPAWESVDMSVPTPVVIANGIVYALSDGDYSVQFGPNGNLLNVEERKEHTGHAVLYALDAETGKVLYTSGDTMKSFSHFSAFTVSGGRIYVGTYDGTLYAFGLGIEQ